jgi:hypothetical protein
MYQYREVELCVGGDVKGVWGVGDETVTSYLESQSKLYSALKVNPVELYD